MTKVCRAYTAATDLGITVEEVLRLAHKPADATENSLVDLDAIRENMKPGQKKSNRRKTAVKTPESDRRPATPKRSSYRAHGNDSLIGVATTARDREILVRVQDWANSYRLPQGFVPELVAEGKNHVSYVLPGGKKVKVTTAVGAQIKSGVIKVEPPKPSYKERKVMADLLASLSFISDTCEICGQPMEQGSQWESSIHLLLVGRFVLPRSGTTPDRKAGQGWMIFRSADIICRMTEKYLQPWVVNPDLGDVELERLLIEAVPQILADTQEKRPETTVDEVLDKIENVLDFLGGKHE